MSKKTPRESSPPPKPRVVELPEQSYQPSVAELREPIQLAGTFEDAIGALVSPVQVRRVPVSKWKVSK